MKPQILLLKSKSLGIEAFLLLLRNRRLFILQELSIYLLFLGVNVMGVFTAIFTGDYLATLGSLGGLGVIGLLMSFKVKSLYNAAQQIFSKLNIADDEARKQEMERDLTYFDLLFSNKYGKNIKIKFEGN